MPRNYISVEKMKYKKDRLSYALILLGFVVNIFYFFALYKNNSNFYYTIQMGGSVIYNLLFMLIVFLSAENIKNYRKEYAIVVFVVGIFQLVRMIGYPKQALDAGQLSMGRYITICIYLGISSALLMAGAIISYIKSTILKKFVDGKLVFEQE